MGIIQQPGVSNPDDKIVWSENFGALLLFFPTELKTQIPTAHGETDAVVAKVVRLDDGRVWENGLVFPSGLVGQLKGAIANQDIILGRLGQGENKKGNAPWILLPHTAEEVMRAEQWIAANPRIKQAAQSAPPTPPAWGAPATPAAPQWGGAPAPAAAPAPQWGSPAPAATGWGGAPADQVNPAAAGWGAPAPQAPAAAPAPVPPAPAGPPADPALVAALTAKGVQVPPGTTHEAALGLWAIYGG